MNNCYICLNPSKTTSPCLCGAFVHPECLRKWKEGNIRCSICRGIYYDVQLLYGLCVCLLFYYFIIGDI